MHTRLDFQNLTKIAGKEAGKNQHELAGFYQDQQNNQYFLKVPNDKIELFTEFFAGSILKQFKEKLLIEKKYHDLIVTADLIKLPNGQYGLIQPRRQFKEVWKYFIEQKDQYKSIVSSINQKINTLLFGEKDRWVLDEMLFGQEDYYPSLAKLGSIDSLAASILLSLVIGDYSVHSGNIVCFENLPGKNCHFGRIDFGAAWRNYAHSDNQDVMNPKEYHGYKGYTKGYHLFYTKVPGLYETVSDQAHSLQKRSNTNYLIKLIDQAIDNLPADLLTESDCRSVASYMGLDSFSHINNPDNSFRRVFTKELTSYLISRIENLANLPKMVSSKLPKKLTASETFDFAFSKLLNINNAWQGLKPELLVGSDAYAALFIANQAHIILVSAACDDDILDGRNAGTTPLSIVLQHIQDWQKIYPTATYLVPLAECHPIFGIFSRQHWTLLKIHEQKCNFYDPCSNGLLPNTFSASTLYSLEPLKNILNKASFELENEHYLGWQSDDVNCGRFCAAIVDKIAETLFSKKDQGLVEAVLMNTMQIPKVGDMLVESASCLPDRIVLENNTVRLMRGLPVNKGVNPRDYIESWENSKNAWLNKIAENDLFEKGEGGLAQLKKDFIRCQNNIYLQGKALPALLKKADEINSQVLANWLSIPLETAEHMVAAHSQGPMAFLPYVLAHGIKHVDPATLAIVQPKERDFRIDYFSDQKSVWLRCSYDKFPLQRLHDSSVSPVNYIDGKTRISYSLSTVSNTSGWLIKDIDSASSDILRILHGQQLSEAYLNSHYCNLSNSTEVIRHPAAESSLMDSGYFLKEEKGESKSQVAEQPATAYLEEFKESERAEQQLIGPNLTLDQAVLAANDSITHANSIVAPQEKCEELGSKIAISTNEQSSSSPSREETHQLLATLVNQKLNEAYQSQIKANEALSSKLKEAQQLAASKADMLALAERSLQHLQLEKDKLFNDYQSLSHEFEASKKANLSLSANIAEASQQMQTANERISQAHQRFDQLQQDNINLQGNLAKLTEENTQYRIAHDSYLAELQLAQQDIAMLTHKLAEAQQHLSLKEAYEEAHEKSQADYAKLEEEYRHTYDNYRRDISHLQAECQAARELAQEFESKYLKLQNDLEQENRRLLEALDEVNRQLKFLQEAFNQLKSENASLIVANTQAEINHNHENAKLSAALQIAHDQLERLNENNTILQSAMNNLQLLLSTQKDGKTSSLAESNNQHNLAHQNVVSLTNQLQIAHLQLSSSRANIDKIKELTSSKAAWWKLPLAIAGIIIGVALLTTGIGALAGIVLVAASVSSWLMGTFVAGGAILTLSGSVYVGQTKRLNHKHKTELDNLSAKLLPPVTAAYQQKEAAISANHSTQANTVSKNKSNRLFGSFTATSQAANEETNSELSNSRKTY